MRASIERSELLRVLGPVTKVVESRNTIPILANVLLTVANADGPGTVSIKGTDMDIAITATGTATVDQPGTVTVDAKRLEDIVRKLPASALISVEAEGTTLTIKSGRSRFKLPTLPAEDFPDISVGAFVANFDVDLAALFKPVAFAISTEETRFYLNGIYLHAEDGNLRAVATDGHRLAQHDVALPETADAALFPGVIVPRKTVGLVPAGVVSVSISKTKIQFVTDTLTVTSKVVDGTFPDYRRVIPHGNDKVATVERTALYAAADRVDAVSGERGRSVKLSLADECLRLTARGESGEALDEIEVVYDCADIDIGFNAAYLRDVLGVFDTDNVTLKLNEPGSPALITAGGPLLCVLMPMRISYLANNTQWRWDDDQA